MAGRAKFAKSLRRHGMGGIHPPRGLMCFRDSPLTGQRSKLELERFEFGPTNAALPVLDLRR